MCYSKHIKKSTALLGAALGLARNIVGITLFYDAADYESAPEKEFRTSLSYCSMVRLAAEGHARKGSITHVSCPGARRALGMIPVNEDYVSGQRYMSLGMYAEREHAAGIAAQVSLLPQGTHGVALQPLQSCLRPPHVVIIICNAYQAMRLAQGQAYANEGPQGIVCFGNQGVCSELTARPHVTGRTNVSLLCANTRYSCAWGDGEVGVAMPLGGFASMAEGVLATLNAAEPDNRKQDIAARAGAAGLDVKTTPGGAYFLGPLVSSASSAK